RDVGKSRVSALRAPGTRTSRSPFESLTAVVARANGSTYVASSLAPSRDSSPPFLYISSRSAVSRTAPARAKKGRASTTHLRHNKIGVGGWNRKAHSTALSPKPLQVSA
ncbi:unnamed protein product, partial [Ectocarpus sp. 4 AP-2014]